MDMSMCLLALSGTPDASLTNVKLHYGTRIVVNAL
jgi:hypothetical protein